MSNFLRPDEMATESEIRKSKNRSEEFKTGLTAIAGLGTSSIGHKAVSKILPFLSEYIPEDLAFKGINKVVPGLGSFLKNGLKQGLSLKSGLDYLKNEFKNESQQQPAKESRNIIQQYSPELFQYIQERIQKGIDPISAGATAQNISKFSNIIKKISKDHKADWSSILQTVFGNQENQQQSSSKQAPQQEIFYDTQENQQQRQQQGQQQGQGSQVLMEALQLAAESRKRRQR